MNYVWTAVICLLVGTGFGFFFKSAIISEKAKLVANLDARLVAIETAIKAKL